MTDHLRDNIKTWVPVAVLLLGVVAGYVKLTDAVKANALAIEKQAMALEAITDIMLSDREQAVTIEDHERRITNLEQRYD